LNHFFSPRRPSALRMIFFRFFFFTPRSRLPSLTCLFLGYFRFFPPFLKKWPFGSTIVFASGDPRGMICWGQSTYNHFLETTPGPQYMGVVILRALPHILLILSLLEMFFLYGEGSIPIPRVLRVPCLSPIHSPIADPNNFSLPPLFFRLGSGSLVDLKARGPRSSFSAFSNRNAPKHHFLLFASRLRVAFRMGIFQSRKSPSSSLFRLPFSMNARRRSRPPTFRDSRFSHFFSTAPVQRNEKICCLLPPTMLQPMRAPFAPLLVSFFR